MPKASKENSKIRMSIMKAHGDANEYWYSPAEQNNKPSKIIVDGMVRRFKNYHAAGGIKGKVNVLLFYEDNFLIHKENIA